MEVWKDIELLDGRYQISNLGNIRNSKSLYVLALHYRKDGYIGFTGSNSKNKRISFLVHREVAKAFLGIHDTYNEINHKNGIKIDNTIENLEWANRSINIKHAFDSKLRTHKGIDNTRVKLSEENVIEIFKSDKKFNALAIEYDISRSTIGDIKGSRSWRHVTDNLCGSPC